MKYKPLVIKSSLFLLIVGMMAVLNSCATQKTYTTLDSPGFFMAFFHGFLILFSLIFSNFSEIIRIYAVPNSGLMYDLGFFVGATLFIGGCVASISSWFHEKTIEALLSSQDSQNK